MPFLQLLIQASDGRDPPRTANSTITVSITRDESTPQFVGTPYNNARVSENIEVGREFFNRVRATDQDLQVRSALDTKICFVASSLVGEIVLVTAVKSWFCHCHCCGMFV